MLNKLIEDFVLRDDKLCFGLQGMLEAGLLLSLEERQKFYTFKLKA